MAKRAGIQQALLRPAYAHHYPGIRPNEWQPLAVMLAQVHERTLDPEHFALRETRSAGAREADWKGRPAQLADPENPGEET